MNVPGAIFPNPDHSSIGQFRTRTPWFKSYSAIIRMSVFHECGVIRSVVDDSATRAWSRFDIGQPLRWLLSAIAHWNLGQVHRRLVGLGESYFSTDNQCNETKLNTVMLSWRRPFTYGKPGVNIMVNPGHEDQSSCVVDSHAQKALYLAAHIELSISLGQFPLRQATGLTTALNITVSAQSTRQKLNSLVCQG